MRKKKELKDVAGQESIEVLELRLSDSEKMISVLTEIEGKVNSFRDIFEKIKDFIPLFTTIKKENVENITYSELDELEGAFRETNKSFLKRLESLGIKINLKNQNPEHPQKGENSTALAS